LSATKRLMSSRTPTEDENSTAHTPHDVMLSASEASAFNSGIKQILRREFILSQTKGLRMTFKDRSVGGPHFSKDHTKVWEINSLELRALRLLRCELALILARVEDIPQSIAEQIKAQDDQ
jgi:hypothetical protein